MKAYFGSFILALLLACGSATASEPVKCYEIAWGSKEKAGLGLTAGQAVTLCSGATDAKKVIQCFVEAWAHPNNGGLGLNAGQAVTLCKENSLQ
jgi:hypothetical protein